MALDPARALILSGGGSRGAYEAGVCIGLYESGYRPDIICGTSIGAINGAFLASGAPVEDLARIWRAVGTRKLAPSRRDIWRVRRWPSWSRGQELARIIESHIDFDKIHSSKIRFIITAVGLCCGELVAFSNEDITVQHVLASASFPGVFPPVRIGDDDYIDGGIVQNTPLKPAINAGATELLAVLTDPVDHCTGVTPRNILETMARVSDIQNHHALKSETHHAEAINDLLRRRQEWKDWHQLDIRFIGPEEPLGGKPFSVDAARTEAQLEQGRRDGEAFAKRSLV